MGRKGQVITNGFTYLGLLVCMAGTLKLVERLYPGRFFEMVPPIVLLYFGVMLSSTFGLWSQTPDVNNTYLSVKSNLLPAMIFLMLLKSDLRQIRSLGSKMLLGFFAASISVGIGFVVAFALFHQWFEAGSWKTFAALSGSWMGGTGNMAAIQEALNVPESKMGYTLLIDSIDYAIWVVLLLALVPHAKIFNRWTGANTENLDAIGANLPVHRKTRTSPSTQQICCFSRALRYCYLPLCNLALTTCQQPLS
jgi:uncharacterized membrane protein